MGLNDFFPVLEDDRAMLRPLQMDDLHSLLPVALQNSLWKVGIQRISGEEDLANYIRQAIRERESGQSIPFLIIDKKTIVQRALPALATSYFLTSGWK